MPSKIIYIVSDNRSGSTLLDQLLGAHDQIFSLGEVYNLRAFVLEDRRLYNPLYPLVCTCGHSVARCEFWQDVRKALGTPLEVVSRKPSVFDLSSEVGALRSSFRRVLRSALLRNPMLLRHSLIEKLAGLVASAEGAFQLFDAIAKVRNYKYLVDSSKSPFRMRSLYNFDPKRMRILVLSRDYRAVAYSKMKRGHTVRTAVQGWANRMRTIRELVSDIPVSECHHVRYEDLCANSDNELKLICNFLGIPFSQNLLTRCANDLHHLGGSPSKFDPEKSQIVLDDSYLHELSTQQLRTMTHIVGGEARQWGYD